MEVTKRRAAEEGGPRDPMAAQQTKDKIYVGKGAIGGKQSNGERRKGKEIAPGQYDDTIIRILEARGLKAKFMAMTGGKDPNAAEQR